jgi:pimeloyl-ACP methyl ester carboxylesterase
VPLAEINGHRMYYEVHGSGEDLLCMGGWGTFCHGFARHAPRALLENYRVLFFDYRGLGESTDDPDVTPSMKLYAGDAAELCDHLGIERLHVVGMVGMGGCVAQELALARPDLARSLVTMGTWARADAMLADQLELFRTVHREVGFFAFQKFAASFSFDPKFYELHRDRILGPGGAWKDLRDRAGAHGRLVEACITHDTTDRLGEVSAPTLVVHAGADVITGPRVTMPLERGIPGARGVMVEDLAHIIAGREQKQLFDRILMDFLHSVEAAEDAPVLPR